MNEYSIKDIADKLQTDKQKVYRAITRLSLSPCKQDGNRYYYDDNVVDLVKTSLENRITTSKKVHQNRETFHISDTNDDKADDLTIYQDYIKTLKEQIEAKDKQIEELQATVKAFTVLQIQQSKPRLIDRIFRKNKESA